MLDRPDEALRQIQSVLEHRPATTADAPGPNDARRSAAEPHYGQGRIHLRSDSHGLAVHEFATAVRDDPDHARAHRYRAEAIRRLIDTDLERTLQSSLQHYIRLGAPLGADDELLQPRSRTHPR